MLFMNCHIRKDKSKMYDINKITTCFFGRKLEYLNEKYSFQVKKQQVNK